MKKKILCGLVFLLTILCIPISVNADLIYEPDWSEEVQSADPPEDTKEGKGGDSEKDTVEEISLLICLIIVLFVCCVAYKYRKSIVKKE